MSSSIVSDAEVINATPEQLRLVAKFYLLTAKKGTDLVRNALVGTIKTTNLKVENVLVSNQQLDAKYAPRVSPPDPRLELDPLHKFPTSFDQIIKEIGLVDKVKADGYQQFSLDGVVNGLNPDGTIKLQEVKLELGIKNNEVTHRFANPARGKDLKIDHALLQQERSEVIKQLGKKGPIPPTATGINWQQCVNNMGVSAAMGAGFGAVFSIPLLMQGQYAQFFLAIGKSGGMGAASAGLSHVIAGTLGEAAGPVAVIVLGTIFDTVGLCKSGDWSRFGKNMGLNVGSTAVGFGCAKGGAVLGASIGSIFPGPGTIIGGFIGGLAGGIGGALFGHKVLSKVGLGGMTKHEQIKLEEAKQTYLKGKMEDLNKNLAKQGMKIPDKTSPKEFEALLHNEEIKLEYQHKWDQLPTLGKEARGVFNSAIKTAFIFARLCSPSGDITDGLKIMITTLGGKP